MTKINISRWLKCKYWGLLLVSSNWNNGVKAGVSYLNSNNVASKSNHNIGTHLELMTMSLVLNSILASTRKLVKHTTKSERTVLVSLENALFARLDLS